MKYKFENVRALRKAQITPQDIILIKADYNYSVFHLLNGKKLTLAKTLMECQLMLKTEPFFRPSRSYMINVEHLIKVKEHEVIMKNNYTTPISRRRKDAFTEYLLNN